MLRAQNMLFGCLRSAGQRGGAPAERPAPGYAHTDYGPENEAQFREVLEHRYGMEHFEAQTCGLLVVNLWCPVENPAYRFPLALLDGSTIDVEQECIRYQLPLEFDNGYNYQVETKGLKHARPYKERVPQAAKDAPALSPIYNPKHRWVYLPDMGTHEAVIFKQFDFRRNAKCRATFHSAFVDKYHNDWAECPGRRSVECRVILTFDPFDDGSSPGGQQRDGISML